MSRRKHDGARLLAVSGAALAIQIGLRAGLLAGEAGARDPALRQSRRAVDGRRFLIGGEDRGETAGLGSCSSPRPRAGREGQLAVFGTAGREIGGHYNRGNSGGQPAFDAFDEQSGAPQPPRTGRNGSLAYREGGIPFNRKAPRGHRRARWCRSASTTCRRPRQHPASVSVRSWVMVVELLPALLVAWMSRTIPFSPSDIRKASSVRRSAVSTFIEAPSGYLKSLGAKSFRARRHVSHSCAVSGDSK